MRKIFLGSLFLMMATTSFGQFAKKYGATLAGDKITFVAWANIDSDTLMEAISIVKKGSFSSLYATKFTTSKADTTLLADSIEVLSSPSLLDWNGDNKTD